MFKTILVPAGGASTDEPVFETALAVARASNAHLVFLHVRLDIRDAIAGLVSADLGAGGIAGNVIDDMESQSESAQVAAQTAVAAFCAKHGVAMTDARGPDQVVTAEWRTEIGRLPDVVAAYARGCDLVVAGRSPDRAGVGAEVLEAALMDGGRPLLIATTTAPTDFEGALAIAWKDTPQAARAVAAAGQFIAAARAVTIFSVKERKPDDSAGRLKAMLSWRNAAVSAVTLEAGSQEPAEALLAAAENAGVGLLIMGGYGHSRAREAVFGGFTQHIIDDAGIPVLLAH